MSKITVSSGRACCVDMTSTALLLCLCWLTVAYIGAFSPGISAVRQRKANLWQQRRSRSPSQESIMCSSQGVDTCSRRYRVRTCTGSEDYSAVIGLVNAWWGGRRMSPMLPRLFFDNFCDTTFMAVIRDEAQQAEAQQAEAADTTQRDEVIVGFLCGFVSQSRAGEVGSQGHCPHTSIFGKPVSSFRLEHAALFVYWPARGQIGCVHSEREQESPLGFAHVCTNMHWLFLMVRNATLNTPSSCLRERSGFLGV